GISNCEATDDHGKSSQINIFINNHGEIPFTFYPQDVTADLLKQNGDTLQLTVYTNEKFQKKIKRAQTWAMALYGFSAGLNAGTAGYSTSYSTSYSPRGYAYTTVTHHYDANAAYQAQMAASYQMMTLESAMKNDRMLKEQGYLKTTTIHPGESIVGYMNIKRKKGDIVTVKIPVDNYVYYFDWDVSRNK
ncbi:MAG: hypothetical protein K2G12_11025, partial [Prevotella sp.]|nr:hypothetical protein [Prevotella sp.]